MLSRPCYVSSAVTMLTISVISGLLSLAIFQRLLEQKQASQLVLAQLPPGTAHFSLVAASSLTLSSSPSSKSQCFGTISSTLTETQGQVSIDISSSLALDIDGKEVIQEATGHLAFNPLGQLGASIIHTSIRGINLRLGTLNINPISISLHTGTDGSSPLFQQNAPGPITIERQEDSYQIVAPASLGTLKHTTPLAVDNTGPGPSITLQDGPCDPAKRAALKISLTSLRAALGNPGGLSL